MEVIVISDTKLKIILDKSDMKKYCFSCENLDCGKNGGGVDLSSDICMRRAFRAILSDVKEKNGFDAGEDRMFCQIFPCKSGGCELFVTKIDLSSMIKAAREDGDLCEYCKSDARNETQTKSISRDKNFGEERTEKGIVPHTGRRFERYVYAYPSAAALIAVCRQMRRCGYRGMSGAYCDSNRYYLVFFDYDYIDMALRTGSRPTSFSVAGEYGEELEVDRAGTFASYLREHCRILCDELAVDKLGGGD